MPPGLSIDVAKADKVSRGRSDERRLSLKDLTAAQIRALDVFPGSRKNKKCSVLLPECGVAQFIDDRLKTTDF